MKPAVSLIQQPAIDFASFLGVALHALGYSPGAKADQVRREMSDAERFIACLSALHDQDAPAGLAPNLLSHVSFSVLIAAYERDLVDIMSAASGMAIVTADTQVTSVMLAVMTGTLAQWRDAVKTGSSQSAQFSVRWCFCDIMHLFEGQGLGSVWKDFNAKPLPDSTFYLEDKRRL
jgi:hypothetical protein